MRDDFSPTQPITNSDFSTALAKLHARTEQLHLPQLTYGAVSVEGGDFQIMLAGENYRITGEDLFTWLKNYQSEHNVKIIAMSLSGDGALNEIGARLWLDLDIVPILPPNQFASLAEQVSATISQFDKNGIASLDIDEHNEVHPSFLVTVDHYRQSASPEEWQKLLEAVAQFNHHRLLFISATPRGGGVALMRHALIRLYRLLGVDAHWHILTEDSDVFHITKTKFHNVLQGVSDPSIRLTTEDKELFNAWSQTNAKILEPAIKQANVIVIDDPQPAGLIPFIKEKNPQARLLYRSHIQIESQLIDDVGSPQHDTWMFIWNFVKHADLFIAHPVDAFIPSVVPKEIVYQMPPTTDPLDGLNKPLSDEQMKYYLNIFNYVLLQHNQPPLDTERPYIIQIARFDPSKGIPDVIESYRLLRQKLADANVAPEKIPQLIIAGHGSIDDPDGRPLLTFTEDVLQLPLYEHLASDVKVARLEHIDQLLNALLRGASIVLQLSHREGYEIKVSEALLKGKPVISYRAGGIPLQIVQNENGFVIDEIGNTQLVAEKMFALLTDEELLAKMSKAAEEKASRDILTVPNATRWLELAMGKTE